MKKSQYYISLVGKIVLILTTLLTSLPSTASIRLIIAERPKQPETSQPRDDQDPSGGSTYNRPKPPETGTPKGDPTPAGTRPERNCPDTPKPLTALLANNGSDFTVSEYPTFLFYIPYSPQQIDYMEFLLQDAQQNRTVYHKAVKLTDKAGIIKISLPVNPEYALKVNENYRWHFNLKLNCADSYLVVQGWIRRVPITSLLENQLELVPSQKYLAYQEEDIWYDAIANLAELHFANPDNQKLSLAWTKLMESFKLPWVSEELLVNFELLSPKD